MKWSDIKKRGSSHYKGEKVEPIDLYKAGGILIPFALASIIKYAHRSRRGKSGRRVEDMKKIIHYAEMIVSVEEEVLLGKALTPPRLPPMLDSSK